jgi:predicted phosphoribosyltransferase
MGRTMIRRPFRDRREAGRLLAERLAGYANRPDVLVLALPRGGVPVGFEVARALGVPLDVFIVRKLGVPGHEELALGAIATGGVRILNDERIRALGIPDHLTEAVTAKEQEELARRERLYRGDRPTPRLSEVERSFSLMTAWRPERPCRPPSRRSDSSTPLGSWSRSRLPHPRPATS